MSHFTTRRKHRFGQSLCKDIMSGRGAGGGVVKHPVAGAHPGAAGQPSSSQKRGKMHENMPLRYDLLKLTCMTYIHIHMFFFR